MKQVAQCEKHNQPEPCYVCNMPAAGAVELAVADAMAADTLWLAALIADLSADTTLREGCPA